MASPAFFVTKPNGSLRLLIDYGVLNRWIRRSPYFVARIREILLRLANVRYYDTGCQHGILCKTIGEAKSTAGRFSAYRLEVSVQASSYGYLNSAGRLSRLHEEDFITLLGCTLVTYHKRFIVPATLRDDLMHWYHESLRHPESNDFTRLCDRYSIGEVCRLR